MWFQLQSVMSAHWTASALFNLDTFYVLQCIFFFNKQVNRPPVIVDSLSVCLTITQLILCLIKHSFPSWP